MKITTAKRIAKEGAEIHGQAKVEQAKAAILIYTIKVASGEKARNELIAEVAEKQATDRLRAPSGNPKDVAKELVRRAKYGEKGRGIRFYPNQKGGKPAQAIQAPYAKSTKQLKSES